MREIWPMTTNIEVFFWDYPLLILGFLLSLVPSSQRFQNTIIHFIDMLDIFGLLQEDSLGDLLDHLASYTFKIKDL